LEIRDIIGIGNVLVHVHPEYIDVKLTDFGVSEHFRDLSHDKPTGTNAWRAPEVLQSLWDQSVTHIITPAIDVYSFAMTCYEIVTGNYPLQHEISTLGRRMTWHRIVSEGLRPELPVGLDLGWRSSFADVGVMILNKDPTLMKFARSLLQCSRFAPGRMRRRHMFPVGLSNTNQVTGNQ
jgi:serine/threonine protein kinase